MKAATLERTKQTNKASQKQVARPFKHVFLAALSLFAVLNIIVGFALPQQLHDISEVEKQSAQESADSQNSAHSWAWWLAKLYKQNKENPDIVVFGSSLLGSAHAAIDATYECKLTDALTHRKMTYFENEVSRRLGRHVSIFSLGSPGEMISDSYAISKVLLKTRKKPALVIATIAPRDFIDATLAMPAATDHYKFYSKFTDLSKFEDLAYPEFFARLGASVEKLPLRRLSSSFHTYAESSRTELVQSEEPRISPGKSLVPANAVPPKADNSKEYIERFRTPFSPSYDSEMAFFKCWLRELKDAGIEVMVVCMPTTQQNKALLPQTFWSKFRKDISTVCREKQVKWLDFSDCTLFQDGTDYLDTVHLNAYGAVRLFPAIADHIILDDKARKVLEQDR